VRTLRVERWSDLPEAVATLGFTRPVPTLVVVGAAARLDDDEYERLEPLFGRLAELAEHTGAAVVDGGTDTGVMRLLGRARAYGHTFPLVGVVVEALAVPAGAEVSDGQWPLEPNHSHVLLVPGTEWGDEARWLARAATLVARGAPSVTVLVNGGRVAYTDAEASLAEGRTLLVAAGSGGTADALAAGVRDGSLNRQAHFVGDANLVDAVELSEDGGQPLFAEIERILSDGGQPWTT
jgi:SLOG in TRPM, prokaryote